MNKMLAVAALLLASCSDPFVADGTRSYSAVATGGEHTCAVADNGDAYCWGRGVDGELGIGTKENRSTPAKVAGNIQFKDIAAGENHSCGLAIDGTAYCWGWNPFYQRGNPTDSRDAEPVPVTSTVRFQTLSAGAHHTCALSVDSLAYCWGNNRYGQGGDGTTNTIISPKAVQGGIKFIQISAGSWHSCATTAAGSIFCWGNNESGQLGIGSAALLATVPTAVVSTERFAQVDGGFSHTCAVATSTTLYCWGSNEYGELGNAGVFKPGLPGTTTPQPTSTLFRNGQSISAGVYHTCAVAVNGSGRCWGRGLYGQLANGATQDHYVPQPIELLGLDIRFERIAAGGSVHACALAEGAVYCWGTGDAGQLGAIGSRFALEPQRAAD